MSSARRVFKPSGVLTFLRTTPAQALAILKRCNMAKWMIGQGARYATCKREMDRTLYKASARNLPLEFVGWLMRRERGDNDQRGICVGMEHGVFAWCWSHNPDRARIARLFILQGALVDQHDFSIYDHYQPAETRSGNSHYDSSLLLTESPNFRDPSDELFYNEMYSLLTWAQGHVGAFRAVWFSLFCGVVRSYAKLPPCQRSCLGKLRGDGNVRSRIKIAQYAGARCEPWVVDAMHRVVRVLRELIDEEGEGAQQE